MLRPNPTDALVNHPAFAELPARFVEMVEMAALPVRLPAGRVLFDPGSRCTSFLVLEAGSIRVVAIGESGREIQLYRVRPGDSCILSVACLLSDAAYPARGLVESDITGLAVPQAAFRQLFAEWRPFQEFVFRFLAERMTELMRRIAEIAFYGLDQRVASALLGHPDPIHITHQRLADEVGSVREVVSRILKEFETQGLVRLGRGRIRVLDREGLTRLASPLGDWSH